MIALLATVAVVLGADQGLPVAYEGGRPAQIEALINRLPTKMNTAKTGEWVKYEFDGGPGRQYFMRIAVVGTEKDVKGRDAVWLEIEFADHHAMKAPLLQLRMLSALGTDDGLISSGAVTRLFVSVMYEKPQEAMPEVVADMFKPAKEEAERKLPEKSKTMPVARPLTFVKGVSSGLMTSAGTVSAVSFEARYRSVVVYKVWMSEQIPLLKLARMEIPKAGQRVEIRDFGVNAKPLMVLPAPNAPKLAMGEVDDVWRKFHQAAGTKEDDDEQPPIP